MSYQSIDEVQQFFAQSIFARTQDPKKSAGRALGTFIETIMYYLLKSWGFQNNISIETKLPEYGESSLTHNVEFTLHKNIESKSFTFDKAKNLSTKKIINLLNLMKIDLFRGVSTSSSVYKQYIDIGHVIKNAAFLGEDIEHNYISYIDTSQNTAICNKIKKQPFAMIECKRVGKEGDSKGPQTIEKAKQGAYVARVVSSVQKIKTEDGSMKGLILNKDGTYTIDSYYSLLERIIFGDLKNTIDKFIMTIGVVSNHGNWFTSDNPNKETRVLCQSYDWLLFLTDDGLTKFIRDMLEIDACKNAFLYSYNINDQSKKKNTNIFTKSIIGYQADMELTHYFQRNKKRIVKWFNVLSPSGSSLDILHKSLVSLRG